jgi:hypothetical protein
MAVRKHASTKVKRKRRLGTVRPISKISPKGKIALLTLWMAVTRMRLWPRKRARPSITSINMAELRARGHKISVKNGVVKLLASAKRVFASDV